MGLQDRDGRKLRVKVRELGVRRTEEVFEEVGRDVGVQPEKAALAVIDQVRAALLDTGEGRPHALRQHQMPRLGGREA